MHADSRNEMEKASDRVILKFDCRIRLFWQFWRTKSNGKKKLSDIALFDCVPVRQPQPWTLRSVFNTYLLLSMQLFYKLNYILHLLGIISASL